MVNRIQSPLPVIVNEDTDDIVGYVNDANHERYTYPNLIQQPITATSGVDYGFGVFGSVVPSGASNGVYAAQTNQLVWEGTTAASIASPGHVIASLDWFVSKGAGGIDAGYIAEARADLQSGTNITTMVMNAAQIGSCAGNVDYLIGYQVNALSMTGTNYWMAGFRFPADIAAGYGANTRYSFLNEDAGAPISSAAVIKAPLFNLTATVTPSSSADAQGAVGDIRYDDGYIYVKCATGGWKRATLATF